MFASYRHDGRGAYRASYSVRAARKLPADDPTIGTGRRVVSPLALKQPTVLALSGGGAYAAFGAGLLNGWSARGTRSQFTIVTGASSGALIVPVAFLGTGQDQALRTIFTSGEMENFGYPHPCPQADNRGELLVT